MEKITAKNVSMVVNSADCPNCGHRIMLGIDLNQLQEELIRAVAGAVAVEASQLGNPSDHAKPTPRSDWEKPLQDTEAIKGVGLPAGEDE